MKLVNVNKSFLMIMQKRNINSVREKMIGALQLLCHFVNFMILAGVILSMTPV